VAPDDPTRPAMAMDEQALEAELKAAEIEARTHRWSWGWVNKPITLWALSTIAVGVLSFTYTQFSTCRARVDTDSARYMCRPTSSSSSGTRPGPASRHRSPEWPLGGVFDLLIGWTVVHRALRVERRPESLATVSDWARALGNGFAAFTADDAQLQLASTGTCLRRAFWPFD